LTQRNTTAKTSKHRKFETLNHKTIAKKYREEETIQGYADFARLSMGQGAIVRKSLNF
jgi:hypothetical protein